MVRPLPPERKKRYDEELWQMRLALAAPTVGVMRVSDIDRLHELSRKYPDEARRIVEDPGQDS